MIYMDSPEGRLEWDLVCTVSVFVKAGEPNTGYVHMMPTTQMEKNDLFVTLAHRHHREQEPFNIHGLHRGSDCTTHCAFFLLKSLYGQIPFFFFSERDSYWA